MIFPETETEVRELVLFQWNMLQSLHITNDMLVYTEEETGRRETPAYPALRSSIERLAQILNIP